MQTLTPTSNKSPFITILSWCLITFSGIGIICTFFQLVALTFILPDAIPEITSWQTTPISSFCAHHFREIIAFSFSLFVTGLIASIGLLRRKSWARILVMLLLAISILALQTILIAQWVWVEQIPLQGFAGKQWLLFLKISSSAWVASLSFLSGWIIKRLDEKATKGEFQHSPFLFAHLYTHFLLNIRLASQEPHLL